MTEQEWAILALAFAELFDTVKNAFPEKISIDKTYTAGKILQMELERIRAKQSLFLDATAAAITSTGWRFKTGVKQGDWQKRNADLEKKKEAQRAQEMGDLETALRLSIEKINERKEE